MLKMLSKSPPAADTSQTPKSNLTARDELLHQVSARREGISTGKSPIFPTSPQSSDFLLLLLYSWLLPAREVRPLALWSLDGERKALSVVISSPPHSLVHKRGTGSWRSSPARPASPNSVCRRDSPFQGPLPLA